MATRTVALCSARVHVPRRLQTAGSSPVLVRRLLTWGPMFRSIKAVSLGLVAALALQVGCGTLLYPERRGTTGGRVDVGVAVMDGLWCFVFLVPGVVAFIVDFSNGAIYE